MADGLDFSLTLQGGFIGMDGVRDALEAAFLGPIQQAAHADMAPALSAASPVRSGALRDSWDGSAGSEWNESRLETEIYSDLDYAPIQEERGPNAGYATRGFEAGEGPARATIATGVDDLLTRLWVP